MDMEKIQPGREIETFGEEKIFTAKVMVPYCILSLAIDYFSHWGFMPIVSGVIGGYAVVLLAPSLYELEQETHILEKTKNTLAQLARTMRRGDRQDSTPQLASERTSTPVPAPLAIAAPGREDVARLTVDEVVLMVDRNTFKVCIGRSLTNGEPVVISFFKKHLKLIGSSQKGKSSMAAALLDAITRTHDPSHVLIALLDFEDMTSKLFAHLPHLAEVAPGGQAIPLHATTREQVLEYLGYIVEVVHIRYEMTKVEIKDEPLLIVYVEEFLSLKDYFKKKVQAASGQAATQAQADYAQFVFSIGEIARLGLKARVQLLLCAQVDYVDEDKDMRDALINVMGGFSFAVRPSAAQAAGFMDAQLLNRNARENKVGQAVVETSDCHDLVLAPEYDLEARLIEFEEAELEEERRAGIGRLARSRSNYLTARNGDHTPAARQVTTTEFTPDLLSVLSAELLARLSAGQDVAPGQEEVQVPGDLARAIEAYQRGATSIDKLAAALTITPWEARKIMPAVKRELCV